MTESKKLFIVDSNRTDFTKLNALNIDVNSFEVFFSNEDIERLKETEKDKFFPVEPLIVRFKFIGDENNYWYLIGSIDYKTKEIKLLEFNIAKENADKDSLFKEIHVQDFYMRMTAQDGADDFNLGLVPVYYNKGNKDDFIIDTIKRKLVIEDGEEKIVDEEIIRDIPLRTKSTDLAPLIVNANEADEVTKNSPNNATYKLYEEVILGEKVDSEDDIDLDDLENETENQAEDKEPAKVVEIFNRLKKVIYCRELSFNEFKIYVLMLVFNENEVCFVRMKDDRCADFYYRCKYYDIPFEYDSDDHFFNNVIDLFFDQDRAIQLQYCNKKLGEMIESDDFNELDKLKQKSTDLIITDLKEKDPVLLMIKSAEEYKVKLEQFNQKYADVVKSDESLKIPEEYESEEDFKEKDPEAYETYKAKLDVAIEKEKDELEIANMKFMTSQNINKKFMIESQMSISFDNTKAKIAKFLENATKNENEAGIKLYQWMLDRYNESISLAPLFVYFDSKKYKPGKFSNTFYMNYDKVVSRVRSKLSKETEYKFIDPIILITRIQKIMNDRPELFGQYDVESYPLMVYYLFMCMIDNEKKNYLKDNGLFIIRFIQHFALFYNDYYLLSERDKLVENLERVMSRIKDDIENPDGEVKYKKDFEKKTIPFIKAKMNEIDEFLEKEKKKIIEKRTLNKLTKLSLVEEGNNPLIEGFEETE